MDTRSLRREGDVVWVRQAEADAGERDDRLTTDERAELAALRKENTQLKRADDVLASRSHATYGNGLGSRLAGAEAVDSQEYLRAQGVSLADPAVLEGLQRQAMFRSCT